jgi:hypothetical protein
VIDILARAGRSLSTVELARRGLETDQALAAAVFLADPSAELGVTPDGPTFNPSTVFKLKQNLWHAGLLSTRAHSSAGKSADGYLPADDVWGIEKPNAS